MSHTQELWEELRIVPSPASGLSIETGLPQDARDDAPPVETVGAGPAASAGPASHPTRAKAFLP